MKTNKKILGKINTQRCSVTLISIVGRFFGNFEKVYTCDILNITHPRTRSNLE
jgi:hypothetical protein